MPDVIVRRNPDYLKTVDLKDFFSDLQLIIAEVLTVPGTGGEITT